jgi:hypothetical protein
VTFQLPPGAAGKPAWAKIVLSITGLFSKSTTKSDSGVAIAYDVEDPSIATVDSEGLITAVSRGQTWLYVTSGRAAENRLIFVQSIPCPGDANGDDQVDVDDLLAVILGWGPCDGCPADFDDNGAIDVDDMLAVILAWGSCP